MIEEVEVGSSSSWEGTTIRESVVDKANDLSEGNKSSSNLMGDFEEAQKQFWKEI